MYIINIHSGPKCMSTTIQKGLSSSSEINYFGFIPVENRIRGLGIKKQVNYLILT